jgi:hypothetical protein
MIKYANIHDYIIGEEAAYEIPVDILGWEWKMKDHIKTSFYYKHGRLLTGNSDDKPVKNIVRPLLNLQYRAEDIDVKDILLYVDDPEQYHLSFLVKKYHDDVFIIENDLDSYFDELKEAKVDYGAGLSKFMNSPRPEVVPLESIAFCDQTNLLGSPIAFKHFYAPDELRKMEKRGWGNEKNGATGTIDMVIALADEYKVQDKQTGRSSQTTGKNVEVYEVHGTLPKSFLTDDMDDQDEYISQLQIVTFYTDKNGERKGITLYRKEEDTLPLKACMRDNVFGRALGFGGVEELFEPQVWTNYDEIRKKELLDMAAKVIFQTTDATFRQRNKTRNAENGEIFVVEDGKSINQINTVPAGISLFERSIATWEQYAQRISSATDPLLGETPPSGTPFKLQEVNLIEGKGLHEYRKGKFAKHIEEVYKDWILPFIAKQITAGTKFLSELSLDEMRYVADCLVRNEVNKYEKDLILKGEMVDPAKTEEFRLKVREDFMRGGNKRFLQILKSEFKNVPIRVKVNVAGKQKNIASMTDKLVNIFRQIFANPEGFKQVMQIPGAAKAFNEILEYSGLSPVDFDSSYFAKMDTAPQQDQVPAQQGASEALQGVA